MQGGETQGLSILFRRRRGGKGRPEKRTGRGRTRDRKKAALIEGKEKREKEASPRVRRLWGGRVTEWYPFSEE